MGTRFLRLPTQRVVKAIKRYPNDERGVTFKLGSLRSPAALLTKQLTGKFVGTHDKHLTQESAIDSPVPYHGNTVTIRQYG